VAVADRFSTRARLSKTRDGLNQFGMPHEAPTRERSPDEEAHPGQDPRKPVWRRAGDEAFTTVRLPTMFFFRIGRKDCVLRSAFANGPFERAAV